MNKNDIKIKEYSSSNEKSIRKNILQLFRECPLPDNELLSNLGLFINRQGLSNMLFKQELYSKIIEHHGVIMEFGTRWGQNLALFASLRGIYEPFNHNRRIIGFDTFEGFPNIHNKDGKSDIIKKGSFNVTKEYEEYLADILDYHEQESPITHIKKYEIIKGDANIEIEKYFNKHPETIVALAYFDFDIYEPTRRGLELIRDHITKGTVIGFDELNHPDFPGETLALKEIFEINKLKIRRTPYSGSRSYIIIE